MTTISGSYTDTTVSVSSSYKAQQINGLSLQILSTKILNFFSFLNVLFYSETINIVLLCSHSFEKSFINRGTHTHRSSTKVKCTGQYSAFENVTKKKKNHSFDSSVGKKLRKFATKLLSN